ncbi:hypothetical protein [Archangium sp.]|uniref:hypothetical protein n=1 Tax=Archangium sp. TaxID=1872627 RepID=UPI00389997F9
MDQSLWPVRDGPRDVAFLAPKEDAGAARPVAHAFSRCGFSGEEWRLLHDAPLRAFLWVATVDGPVRPREREACRRVLWAGQYSVSPLVGRVYGEALGQLEHLGPERLGEPPDLEPLRPLCARVAERLGLGEALRFQRCLWEVGWRVARASNGLLGLLGRVRAREHQALAGLAGALGFSR